MITHIRKPFLCRQGQFSEGRDLCASLAKWKLEQDPINIMFLGRKKYTFDSESVLAKAKDKPNDRKGDVDLIVIPVELWSVKIEEAREPHEKKTKKVDSNKGKEENMGSLFDLHKD